MRRAFGIALLCLALAPSAYLASQSRDVPHLGYFHDDALYWVSAKSLAEGAGYRIQSLPGEPYQTKYPPLYPALLAGVWHLQGNFPDNLAAALLASWLALAACILGARVAIQDLTGPGIEPLALTALIALNPYFALCGISLLSELPFTFLLLASMMLVQRARNAEDGAWLAAAAGVVASAAFLTRTAGGLLLAAGPAALLISRQPRRAAVFAGAMLPGAAGWTLWAAAHRLGHADATLLYYTDYLGYWAHEVSAANLPLIVWRNLDSLLSAIGGMLVFGLGDSFAGKSLARVLAAAALAGTVRLAGRARAPVYFLFAGSYLATLLVWNYSPDQRFLIPVFPVLLAGFSAEFRRVAGTVRAAFARGRVAERVAGSAMAAALAGMVLAAGAGAYSGLFRMLPRFVAEQRSARAARHSAYAWAEKTIPRGDAALAYDDAVFYLSTGRKACRSVISPALLYGGDRVAIERSLEGVGRFARERKLSWAVVTPHDFIAELPDADRRAALRIVRADPRFEPVYEQGGISIFRIR